MKKYILASLLVTFLTLSGCSKKDQDPYSKFRSQNSSSIYLKGEQALANGNYSSSIKYFEALDALYPFGPNAKQSQLDIIYAYYMEGEMLSALTAAERFIHLYPRAKHVDYAYYMSGVVGLHIGLSWLQRKVGVDPGTRDVSSLKQSFNSFALLTRWYPHSVYSPNAVLRMAYIRNLLARHELDTARFYFDRSAYVAAANRASTVAEHYQGSTSVPDALVVMVQSYRKLGLANMAQQSYAILQANYPDSSAARKIKT